MTDTIAAIATPAGKGAIGIVRISGPDAAAVLRTLGGAAPVARPRRLCHGVVRDGSGAALDDVMWVFFPAPGTFTGEDAAEIHCHGSPVVLSAVLDAAVAAGARIAHPGEFSSRAFANGKLDLTQAEAISALIDARTQAAARVAARQLVSASANPLTCAYDELVALSARIEAVLDYPDEDLDIGTAAELAQATETVAASLRRIARTYRTGSLLTQGAHVVLVGPVNAGKSSLLNALAGTDRALVDPEPGTTRDIVEAAIEIDGIPVTLVDTAGFRPNAHRVEQAGIHRATQRLETADVVLLVLDGTADAALDPQLAAALSAWPDRVVAVFNKSDCAAFRQPAAPPVPAAATAVVSAQTGAGLDALCKAVGAALHADALGEEHVLTTVRQRDVVQRALAAVERAQDLLEDQEALELAAAELYEARHILAELWGRNASHDVIETIFSAFCLGK